MVRPPEYDKDWSDPPLMSRSSLMLTALRRAAAGPTSIAALADVMRAARERIGDPVRVNAATLEQRIATALDYLEGAQLIQRESDGTLAITERGRRVLTDHPTGIDGSVLSEFPEFRSFVHERAEHAARTAQEAAPSPHPMPSPAYQEGYRAYRAGAPSSDNPYDEETINHLAWANGWFEARDQGQEQAGQGSRPVRP